MRHDERHAALAAYAFWSKLEQTGSDKDPLLHYYDLLFNPADDPNMCPACIVADQQAKRDGLPVMCDRCPCEWGETSCTSLGSPYLAWRIALLGSSGIKRTAGDVANIMRKWCERVGVIAPREA